MNPKKLSSETARSGRYKVSLVRGADKALQSKLELVFEGENLLQMILHAHLLLERAITSLISKKLKKPEAILGTEFGRLSFQNKLGLYVALYDPPSERTKALVAFNKLRNALAHRMESETEMVALFLRENRAENLSVEAARWHVFGTVLVLLAELKLLRGLSVRPQTEKQKKILSDAWPFPTK